MLALILLACGVSADCEVIVYSPDHAIVDNVDPAGSCVETAEDYTGCCPDGYEPVGIDRDGNLVCWCES